MTDQTATRRDVASFLTRNGWVPDRGGLIGELWRPTAAPSGSAIAVPYELDAGTAEYRAVIARLADHAAVSLQDMADEIEREFRDIHHYKIGDRFVVDESVLLDSASTVLTNARRMVRAAATTARKPRPTIGANYSPPGDAFAAQMRLSHTRRGSFVLPVVMPVEPPELSDGEILGDRTAVEPGERRVTRTLAAAVAAINSVVVVPDREPTTDDVIHLIQSGVSSEIVAAVRAIATDSGVQSLDIRFQWAPGLQAPGGIPERVVIPDEAATVLSRVERKLKRSRPETSESLSGQIVEIRHVPDEPMGEIAIRTIRNNRSAEVRITTPADVIRSAYDWAKQSRAIIARGNVVTSPGRPLSIPRPEQLQPIDELFAAPH
ncbi:hypothetical protein [Microbacterium stercoris]|uniref:Uncharacterized protein n=1 Tax=Microbacterium stercoris TaxID=2820289 RepID=A0A939QQY4_9MICO|nr:hypothetical protein [Microbacterium stercoris]MBO3663876.1 hypothetical protein [Microbacterium stercoris]